MPREIRGLADTILRKPITVQVTPPASTAEGIDESVYFVEKRNKPALLAHLVNELPMSRAIVFARTKHGADRVVRHLHTRGIRAEAIHGNKSQNARQRALDNFRAGKIPLLIATDIASRGIDVDDVTHVVNYDLTHEPETYVHRIGRTARANRSGAAVSFCDSEERPNLRAIEKLIRRAIPVKTDQPVYATDDAQREPRQHREHQRVARPQQHSHPRAGNSRTADSRHTTHATHGLRNERPAVAKQAKPHPRHPVLGLPHSRRATAGSAASARPRRHESGRRRAF